MYGLVSVSSSGGDTNRQEQIGIPSVMSDDDLLVVPLGSVEKVYRTVSRDIHFLDSKGSGVLWPSSHGLAAACESRGVGDAGGDDAVAAQANATTANNTTSRKILVPLVEEKSVVTLMVRQRE